jgi:hypothetical protein
MVGGRRIMDFYWELIQKDGTIIEIPPDAVDVVKRRWEQGLPIHTKHQGSIPPSQISAFRPTEKPATSQPLLEEVAQAFNEPVINDDESIAVKWVKKRVTQNKWDKYYGPTGYKKLGDENGMVTVAFRLPIHQVDPQLLQYCDESEIRQLERR